MANDLGKNIQIVEKKLAQLYAVKEKEETKNKEVLAKLKSAYDEKVEEARKDLAEKLGVLNPEIDTYEKQKQGLYKLKQQMDSIMGVEKSCKKEQKN